MIIAGIIVLAIIAIVFIVHHIKLEINYKKLKKEVAEIIKNTGECLEAKASVISFDEMLQSWVEYNKNRPAVDYLTLDDYLKANFTFNKI